ncbi:unnamed protein product [Prunus armeniaca]|uniref:Uncharacterized protein n=1 Tax=Prunus armeniaca TaxID=36596 RepID=A0A6J5TGV4_PRUAR|nr:unnamed protein product [Prunus armeniaca]
MGEKLGNYLGSFIMVDRGLNGDYLGSFLHIKVGEKISEPLKHCVTLRLAIDEPAKKYEIDIRAENGLTGKRFGLVGDGTQLDHSVSPPKVVGVVHPCEAMVNLRGETDMEDDGLGSDPVLHLFKKRRLFSIEREGHTSTTLVGEGPGDTHTSLLVSFEVPRNKEVMTELPDNKIVEKASVDSDYIDQ